MLREIGYPRKVRVPRLTLAKLQSKIRTLEADLEFMMTMDSANRAAHQKDYQALLAVLKDAVALIDLMQQRAGKQPLPLLDGPEVKRLEAARLLSLGV